MTEMIERVALALWNDRNPDRVWNDLDRLNYAGHARAAIEALREPTEAMAREAWAVSPTGDREGGAYVSPDDAIELWTKMIDAALKGEG